jgi:serine/threonine-protein kinase
MIESRPGDAFEPGDLLNNTYRIESILGRGGTSDVYRVRNEINGRLMALKVLKAEFSSNDDYTVLLTREEQIREVQHDSVVRYSENGRTEKGLVYLLMDYVEGPALDAKLKQGPMSADDLLTIARRVTGGLRAAHSRNIVHRDLSPDNIILRDGDPERPVIIDFGIAKDTNPGAETIVGNEFAGKYAYAAPEQLNGQTDARSDIYSLGALLLANFRGANPDVGRYPMEVVQKKSEPMDTSGVPEPLKALIDRMCAPDPMTRMQSAGEVLAFLDNPEEGSALPTVSELTDMDATVVVPVTTPPEQTTAQPSVQPKPVLEPLVEPPAEARQSTPVERKSRGGMMAALAVLLIGGGGGGAYLAGLLDPLFLPSYPPADPFVLKMSKTEEGQTEAKGFVPSEEVLETLRGRMDETDLTLASGEIVSSWGSNVIEIVNRVEGLETWQIDVEGNTISVSGATSVAERARDVTASLNALQDQIALTGPVEIMYKPPFLATADVTKVLDEMADCGPLSQPQASQVGYGPQSIVVVSGRVAETATRVQMFDRLRETAGDRQVVLDLEVLNPTLCLIESYLPTAPESDIDVNFSMGDTGEANTSGRFFVGENPVIDVILPPDVRDGYLTVSILDVSGNVFHLLPNLNRQGNDIEALRGAETGSVSVRVAFSVDEAQSGGLLAFRVDDSTLGKSKVIVLHSTKPLFEGLRPTTESAGGYAEALKEHYETDRQNILSLDSRILETARP